MKVSAILLGIFLTASSCINEKQPSLDQSKRDSITKEIETALNQVIAGWETRNISTAYTLFSNGSDFTFIGGDGSIMDFSDIIEMSKPAFDAWKEVKYTLVERKLKIVNQNLVIVLTRFSTEITYLNGTIEKYPKVGCTFIFDRINDKWIVTHFQESTLAPEIISPEKK